MSKTKWNREAVERLITENNIKTVKELREVSGEAYKFACRNNLYEELGLKLGRYKKEGVEQHVWHDITIAMPYLIHFAEKEGVTLREECRRTDYLPEYNEWLATTNPPQVKGEFR